MFSYIIPLQNERFIMVRKATEDDKEKLEKEKLKSALVSICRRLVQSLGILHNKIQEFPMEGAQTLTEEKLAAPRRPHTVRCLVSAKIRGRAPVSAEIRGAHAGVPPPLNFTPELYCLYQKMYFKCEQSS